MTLPAPTGPRPRAGARGARLPVSPADLLGHAGAAGLYLGVLALGNTLTHPEVAGIGVFWPAAGVAVAWLLLTDAARLPLALGLLVVTTVLGVVSQGGLSGVVLLLVLASHAVLVVTAWWLARRAGGDSSFGPRGLDLTTTRGLVALARVTTTAAAVSAPVAVLASVAATGLWDPWVWLTWVVRNVVAVVVTLAAALLLAAARDRRHAGTALVALLTPGPRRRARTELAALVAATTVLCLLVFGLAQQAPLSFVVVAATVWAGRRFTPVVVALHSFVVSLVAAIATARGSGPFSLIDDPWARTSAVQLFVLLTTVIGLLLATSTLREQRLTERLREASARFDGLLTRLDDYIWSAEVLPDRRLRLRFASAPAVEVFGGAAPQAGEQDAVVDLLRWVPAEDHEVVRGFYRELVERGTAEAEFRLVGGDGVVRWAWSRASARAELDGLVVEGITTDISQRHALDELRTQFLAIAGHELRTPLTVIRGYAETLGEELEDRPRAAGHAAAIGRRAQQLETLVGDFFDLATVENGRVALTRTRLDLADLVADVAAEHAAAAARADVRVQLETSPAEVDGDAVRLRQVVDNLLDNAVKYGCAGGRVQVRCRPVHGETGARAVVLEVSDDGIGVPPEELPQLFERFYRASTGRARTVDGTGLGLAVVRAVTEAHGGAVEASAGGGGHGLRIAVRLPAAAPLPGEHAPDADDPATLTG
ncbi:ATP-binding protein [Nocardioides nanhaiensis]|uniref:histidine kinase n=1 Tax=Nocardioides nanhaiensis TaxID=1476871 RepID=A0ABP8WA32_9ACTN